MLVHRYTLPLIVAAWVLITHFTDTQAPRWLASWWAQASEPVTPERDAGQVLGASPTSPGASEAVPACVARQPWPSPFGWAWTDSPATTCPRPQ